MATMYSHIAANKRKSVLLLAFFVIFVFAIGWLVDRMTESGGSFLFIAGVVSIVMTLVGYFQGDSIALWTSGAHQITPEQNPYVFRMVENLAITSGLPVPKVYVIEDPSLNAFATGRDPKHASIAVTTGLVERLENEELEGVIAHELSHIGNYDIRFMMLIGVLVGIIALLADMFVRSSFLGHGGRRDRSGGNGVLMLIGLVLLILSPVIAQLIRLAASRRREYLADASGALLTRYPEGLARALEKIGTNSRPLARANNATAHLFISNPFGHSGGVSRMFSTHPPIEDRIRALREMGGSVR